MSVGENPKNGEREAVGWYTAWDEGENPKAPAMTASEMLEKAHAEVSAICHGKPWRMSIPARLGEDSDLVIGEAIRVALSTLRALEEENARLREALNAVKPFLDPWRLTAPPFKPGQYNAAITLVLAAPRAKEASKPK